MRKLPIVLAALFAACSNSNTSGSASSAGATSNGSSASASSTSASTTGPASSSAGSTASAGSSTSSASSSSASASAGTTAGSSTGGSTASTASTGGSTGSTASSTGSSGSGSTTGLPALDGRITLPSGFQGGVLASVNQARELAPLPNGDLLVGTQSTSVYIIPNAESAGAAGTPSVFITLSDSRAQSVVYGGNGFIYVGTQSAVWKIPYASGDQSEPASSAVKIASVRTGSIAPNSDGDVHATSSVAVSGGNVFVSVGSSCNACVEVDETRAAIHSVGLDGGPLVPVATRIRNAVALAVNPATGTLWAGGAGQDSIPQGHPYEYMDAVTSHGGVADYGWPACEENHHAYIPDAGCANTVQPLVEFPAYSTHIGAVFYPQNPTGTYAFPASYRGGLFTTEHGSWHVPATPPSVSFVAMNGDAPATSMNWQSPDPNAQRVIFMGGLGTSANTNYVARPTGIAVGSQGSLFVADDQSNKVYRIRPVP